MGLMAENNNPLPSSHIIKFSDPPTSTKSEIDFATFKYFFLFGEEKVFINDVDVMNMVLNPTIDDPTAMTNIMMTQGNEGAYHVAHLPNFTDMRGREKLPELRERLLAIIQDAQRVPPNKSNFYKEIIDPAPVLDFTNDPYPLHSTSVTVDIRTNADALQVMTVSTNMSSIGLSMGGWSESDDPTDSYVRVVYTPDLVEGIDDLIPEGGKLVIWNARGFARPSLKCNLDNILKNYNPLLVIITESRVSNMNFRRIFKELKLDMEWEVDESLSISGGLVVLWDKTTLQADLTPGIETIRFLGDIRVPRQDKDSDDEYE